LPEGKEYLLIKLLTDLNTICNVHIQKTLYPVGVPRANCFFR
jgi:hypothetical protein